MSIQTAILKTSGVNEILKTAAALDPGECRLFKNVSWNEYEQLLGEIRSGQGARIYYDEGTLELMAPVFRHEKAKELVTAMVDILVDELDLAMEAAGSTTFKLESLQSGAEPDTCFYIQHAGSVFNKKDIDLRTDPPPDIVVEIDIRRPSRSKLKLYARFGAPEFWRYNGEDFEIFVLSGGKYELRQTSLTFPFVKAGDFKNFIERGYESGRTPTLREFRRWVKENKSAASTGG